MIQFLEVNWTAVWQMTGVGLGVVFTILILLVFVLQGFSALASKLNAAPKPAASKSPVAVAAPAAQPTVAAPADDEAAIATALYLYFQDVHDEESYKLTIKHADHPAWHSELNHHLANY